MSEQNMNPEEEVVTVILTLDNDEVVECAVLTVYTANDKEYIALLPLNEEGESEDGDVYLYRYEEVDGEPTLSNIEDDDEYEVAADAKEGVSLLTMHGAKGLEFDTVFILGANEGIIPYKKALAEQGEFEEL